MWRQRAPATHIVHCSAGRQVYPSGPTRPSSSRRPPGHPRIRHLRYTGGSTMAIAACHRASENTCTHAAVVGATTKQPPVHSSRPLGAGQPGHPLQATQGNTQAPMNFPM